MKQDNMNITNRQEALKALKASLEYLEANGELGHGKADRPLPEKFVDWLPQALSKLGMRDPGEYARDRMNEILRDPQKIQWGCLGRQVGKTTLTMLHMIHHVETQQASLVSYVCNQPRDAKAKLHHLCEGLGLCRALRVTKFESRQSSGSHPVWTDPQ